METKQMSEEAQLLREGREWISRAVRLATQTSKIKVWVPLVCSCTLSVYYLYTQHRKPAGGLNFPTPPSQPSAVVVPETAPSAHATSGQVKAAALVTSEGDIDFLDVRKQAEEAHAAQQFGAEAKLWQEFMDRAPLPQQACPAIGKAYERAGDIEKSIEAYQQCMSFEPENVDILIAFAHALQTKQDFNRAGALYRQAALKDPGNLDAQTGLALNELRQNHLEEAQSAATAVLHKSPENTDALLIEGIVAWRQGRLAEAEKIFSRGASLDDGRSDFHAFLGRVEEAERRPQDALRQYERALALDPSDTEIAERRAHLREGKPE